MPKRVDDNQKEIVKALRDIGATVQSLAEVGKGCPDLLVGYKGANYLMEVKDGSKTKSRTVLTPDEKTWHETWRGKVVTVFNATSAITEIVLEATGLPSNP